jgi:RNA-directed DNA polymerase
MAGMPSPENVSTRLQRIAELARNAPDMAFTNLAHHIDEGFLHEAYRLTRKDGAVGTDGTTATEYERQLQGNLRSLLDRFKSGTYQAPAVRRSHVPKGDGSKRPIGIPTFEDKVLQRAVLMVMEAVYEQEFLECSFGFRCGRSAHQGLEMVWQGLMRMGGGWVLEVDIRSYFDSLDHGHLRGFLDQRVRDGVIRRVVGKWLKAGVLEEGAVIYPEAGTPQGGVISPLLANIYLHEVLDKWFEAEVKARLSAEAFMVRYADDFVIVFRSELDARRVMDVLPRRFEKYGLRLNEQKTRLVYFERPRVDRGARPGTFDLLGFTHYWGKSRAGKWVVKRKTAKDRMSRALSRISEWCARYRHLPIADQHRALVRKFRGHFGYYGITGNSRSLGAFRYQAQCIWKKWLDRRSQRARMPWERFNVLLKRYALPKALVVHSIYHRAANL